VQANRLSDEGVSGDRRGTTDLVIVFDVLGEIQFVNDAVPGSPGGRRHHIGRNLIDYVHPDDLERALQTLSSAAASVRSRARRPSGPGRPTVGS
jgi:PAS domain-containing protein